MPKAKRHGLQQAALNLEAQIAQTVEAVSGNATSNVAASVKGLVPLVEDDTGHRVLVYATEQGMRIDLRYEGDTFWASQGQMAAMFGVTPQNVTTHLRNMFRDGELTESSVCKESLHTGRDGKRYPTKLYDLNALISVGYRVGSKQGTMFRIWATDKLFRS